MTTKVTVYLNEAAVSFFDFKPFNPEKAALRKAISFELDRDVRFASKNGTKATKEDITRALDIVYVQLDVGGDIYPHTTWSQSYRDNGNRPLNGGDVIHLEGAGFFAVRWFGFKEVTSGADLVRKAEERYAAESARCSHDHHRYHLALDWHKSRKGEYYALTCTGAVNAWSYTLATCSG